ncbi:Nn.00g071810.m01.CDS01 [Neocucurbitaria sp. VM-36]
MALWSKTKTQSKAGFDKVYNWVDKLGAPVNRLSNKVGSEAFWPTTLDIESDKAARILKSFCKDGFYQEEDRPTADAPQGKQRVLKKIPSKVIKNAKGLCIFTTMRTGLWVSGSGGAGVLVARKEDGTWSPPSGIMMHTVGVGFLVGVDIYDCVIVINSEKALQAFQSVRCTLGGEISAVAGPAGVGGILDTELHKRQSPLFTYIKSRGFYAGLQLDGTIVIERTDENERFYGERVGVKDILAGKVRHPPYEIRRLMETLRSAQGDTDVDESLIPDEAPPADFEITAPDDKTFGIPEAEDPDPFGVLALQEAGLDIREAGTRSRPTSDQFEFKPSPTSPIYNTFRNSTYRKSTDRSSTAPSQRSSWRTSTISSVLEPRTPSTMVDTSTQTVDMGVQTDDLPPPPTVKKAPPALPPRETQVRTSTPPPCEIPETRVQEATPSKDTVELKDEETSPQVETEKDKISEEPNSIKSPVESTAFDDVDLEDDEVEEEPVIHEVHQAAAPQVITRARVVQVAKPIPPKLPTRNPFRNRNSANSNASLETSRDASAGPSPVVEKHSPDSMPSLMRGDSTSSLSSVEGHRLEQIGNKLKPKYTNEPATEQEKQEEKDDAFHSLPESPVKTVPGGFN